MIIQTLFHPFTTIWKQEPVVNFCQAAAMPHEFTFYSSSLYLSRISGSSTSSHSRSTAGNSGITHPLTVLTSNYDGSGAVQMRQKSTISKWNYATHKPTTAPTFRFFFMIQFSSRLPDAQTNQCGTMVQSCIF